MTKDSDSNVLLAEWTGPYGGVPAFDRMDLEVLESAVDAAMEQERRRPAFERTCNRSRTRRSWAA